MQVVFNKKSFESILISIYECVKYKYFFVNCTFKIEMNYGKRNKSGGF